jgi:copper(I)-binding protein
MKFFTLLLLGSIGLAHAQFPNLENHWLRAAPSNAVMLAAYGELTNNTNKDLLLVGAYSPAFSMTEIHKTIIKDGVARMIHQPELSIKKDHQLIFKPGGLHIMLMHPIIDFTIGDSIKINLIYMIDGKRVVDEIWFPVLRK